MFTWGKRIMLFVVTNLAIMITLSLVLNLLGVGPYLTSKGLNYPSLIVFCLVWGMGGSFISLGLSRIMAKWSMGVQLIDPQRASGEERQLLETVYRLSKQAGLTTMPEVGIYESPEVNAFATGPTKSRALVAVSTGLLNSMRPDEVEGVLAHEVAHIANGDMVTMTLVQGVVNAFVMFFARIIAWGVTQALSGSRDDEESSSSPGWAYYLTTMVVEIVLGFFGMMVVGWVSRMREFRADEGGARLGGREKMIAALRRLQRNHELIDTSAPSLASMKISGKTGGLMALFSTHPPLEDRIAALERATIR